MAKSRRRRGGRAPAAASAPGVVGPGRATNLADLAQRVSRTVDLESFLATQDRDAIGCADP